jgi:ribulose-phosphate 3-epimerase
MIHVIPAILAKNETDFLTKLARVRSFAPKIHIDVMDGVFVPEITWAPADQMRKILDGLPFEAHLMVSDPEHLSQVWLAAGAEQVVIHSESTKREKMICRAAEDGCGRLSLAINPETPISSIITDLEVYENVTVMSVPPGRCGQAFNEIALDKILAIKNCRPGVTITIDGGIKPGNIRQAVEAGAERIIVGSGILEAPDPEDAYRKLLEAAIGRSSGLMGAKKPETERFAPPPEHET